LVKEANGKRMPRQLRSQVQRLDAMQVSVAVLLEWEVLVTTKLGPRAAGDQRFSWHLERTTSLVQVVAAVAVTPLPVVQVEEPLGHLESYWEIPAVVAGHKLPAAQVEQLNLEHLASNTQVDMPER
jgi:hypothetical protein